MTTDILPAIELTTNHDPIGSVIWLHGLGADGNDFVPVVRELDLPDEMPLRFVFPHAPLRPVSINGGMVMRAWYDMTLAPPPAIILPGQPQRQTLVGSEAHIRESQRALEALIEREARRGTPTERIVLAGFSQGGVIALHTGLRYGAPLAGIMALSTYLALGESLPAEKSPANARIPIFMAHGREDEIIPFATAQRSREALERAGYPVEWHEYPMPHSVALEEIQAIGEWLKGLYRP